MPKPQTNVPPRRKPGSSARSGKVPPRDGTSSGPASGANRRPPRRPRRRSRTALYAAAGAIVAAVAVVVVLLVSTGSGGGSPSAVNFKTPAGVKVYGGLGPENVPLQVGPPLAAANTGLTGAIVDGIQCNAGEQLAYHHHVHLAIFINGKPYSVPLGVGMVPTVQVTNTSAGQFADGSTNCLYWLHVHAQDGIVHIESPQPKTFELAQVFGIWHQPLSATQIGSFQGPVTATVNGKPWLGDPAQIPLNEHDQIVLNLGTPHVTPPPISWANTGL